jgi:hypothetical protein
MKRRFVLVCAVLFAWTSSPCRAQGPADRIDFRKNPAFLHVDYVAAIGERLEQEALSKCPAYRAVKKDARQSKLREPSREVDHCIAGLRKTLFKEVDFFEDPGLKKRIGQVRMYGEHWEARTLPGGEWKTYNGDGTPGGEYSYFLQTVLEKRGDLLLLPKNPFPKPAWFDFKKAYGVTLDSRKAVTLTYVFESGDPYRVNGKTLVPVRIEGKFGIWKPGMDSAEMLDASEEEREAMEAEPSEEDLERVPLSELFGADGHLDIDIASGC